MSTQANQIATPIERTIVRAVQAAAAGVVAVPLLQRVNGVQVFPSSFRIQNVGTDPLRVSYTSAGTAYWTCRINTVYPEILSPPPTIWIEVPAGSATYEIDIAYERFR